MYIHVSLCGQYVCLSRRLNRREMKGTELFQCLLTFGSPINSLRSTVLERIKWNDIERQNKEKNKLGSGSGNVKEYWGIGGRKNGRRRT